jgi:hypothetical protein
MCVGLLWGRSSKMITASLRDKIHWQLWIVMNWVCNVIFTKSC